MDNSEEDTEFVHILIDNVRENRCLFDKTDPYYLSTIKKERAWRKIAKETIKTSTECKNKWEELQERFVHELRKQELSSGNEVVIKWELFNELLFLKDSMKAQRDSEQNLDTGDQYDDDELRKFTEEANDTDFVPPSRKANARNRKSSAGARRIQYPWQHEEVVSLIAAVKKRRGLWDVGSDEYKMSKLDSWHEVLDELGLQIDMNEVKSKWSALRVSFKVNLANYRKKKSGQGASTVTWRYFQQMLFLVNDATQSTGSTSTKKLPSSATDQSVLDNFLVSTESTTPAVAVGTRRKRRNVTVTLTPRVSPATSTNSSCSAIPNKVVATLETSDRNSAFCNHLLSELKALSESKALGLRRALNRTLWNFLDSDEQAQLSPVHRHRHTITPNSIYMNNVNGHLAPAAQQNIDNTDANSNDEASRHESPEY